MSVKKVIPIGRIVSASMRERIKPTSCHLMLAEVHMAPWMPQILLSSYGMGMLLIQKTNTIETCKCGTEVCLQPSTSGTVMRTMGRPWCLLSKVKSRHLSGTRLSATQDLWPFKHRSARLVYSISWGKDVQVDQPAFGSHSLILDNWRRLAPTLRVLHVVEALLCKMGNSSVRWNCTLLQLWS